MNINKDDDVVCFTCFKVVRIGEAHNCQTTLPDRLSSGIADFETDPTFIYPEFMSLRFNFTQHKIAISIRKEFSELLSFLEQTVPPCRELSIVRTKLEESCFFAIKALKHVKDKSES